MGVTWNHPPGHVLHKSMAFHPVLNHSILHDALEKPSGNTVSKSLNLEQTEMIHADWNPEQLWPSDPGVLKKNIYIVLQPLLVKNGEQPHQTYNLQALKLRQGKSMDYEPQLSLMSFLDTCFTPNLEFESFLSAQLN